MSRFIEQITISRFIHESWSMIIYSHASPHDKYGITLELTWIQKVVLDLSLNRFKFWVKRYDYDFYCCLKWQLKSLGTQIIIGSCQTWKNTKKIYTSMVCAKIILPEKCVDWDKSEFSTEQCIKPKVLKSTIKCQKEIAKMFYKVP